MFSILSKQHFIGRENKTVLHCVHVDADAPEANAHLFVDAECEQLAYTAITKRQKCRKTRREQKRFEPGSKKFQFLVTGPLPTAP